MDPSEPALKPQWLKSQNGGASGNAISNPNSNGNCNLNRLTSLPCDGLRTHDKDRLGKSKAYSSFGSRSNRNRNRNRNRKQEKETDFFDRDSSLILDRFDSLLDIRTDKDKLRRSRSLISAPVSEIWPDKKAVDNKIGNGLMDGISSKNGFLSNKEFPSLKTNGPVEMGRHVSSPIEKISVESVATNGGEGWNSVLAEVPLTAGPVGSGANRSSATGLLKETLNGLNMAQAVAQAPAHDRTTTQLAIDPQKKDELKFRQCKQLIPVTPSANKNSVAHSSERLKVKGVVPLTVSKPGTQPLNPSPRASFKPDAAKPMSQLGTFQILNREKNGTIISAPPTINPISTTSKVPTTVSKNKYTISKQAKARIEFFNFLRTKASSNGTDSHAETGSDSSPTAIDNSSDEVKSENGDAKSEHCDDKDHCEDTKWDPSADEEISCGEPLDPEEEAFLRSLGWDANAKIDALTKEEIDAFNMKHKERKQFSRCLSACVDVN